ncbi:pesticin C-terminus-like muramidase [[Erwinia] mediterraneensis]|uniref:pesticin C-terminus-like muramidase n=1 Tax=[Erwinia] mediterraneensis TaxID=2161819 RepID=UPI0010326584|nr:pesticin C-terminus-like muramidase [[Erwinia] mediterraneensis]
MEPKAGLLTFRAEGNDRVNSRHFSRKIHYPGNAGQCASDGSGVTIGRGYDMGNRTRPQVLNDLIRAGIPVEQAKKIADGATLRYCEAMKFVKNNREEIGVISKESQLKLFENSYREYALRAEYFYRRRVKNKNKTRWEDLNERIKDVFIDVYYQGLMSIKFAETVSGNDPLAVIRYIENDEKIISYESHRKRIPHLIRGQE